MDEFSLIELITTVLGAQRGADGGVGDDATVLDVPGDMQLVVSTDSLVEGVHFEAGVSPADLGYKSLAVNLSDLAAMGAEPAWYLLALTLPQLDEAWAGEFASGMNVLAESSRIRLVGGDITRGPLNITVTVCGLVEPGQAITRSGAQEGDVIAVSGPTGLAGFALSQLQQGLEAPDMCLRSLRRPVPRLQLGRSLAGLANSCIDISDGLLADLGHIAQASGVGMEIELERLPLPADLAGLEAEARWNLQLGGGDDYELCFTLPPTRWHEVDDVPSDTEFSPTVIGRVVAGEACTCLRADGSVYVPPRTGYVHGGSV